MKNTSEANSERNKFVLRMRQSRRRTDLSQSELARRLGVTPSAVAQWENPNGTMPSTGRIFAIARLANIRVEWLTTGRGARDIGSREAETVSAIALDFCAQDIDEETILTEFRSLSESAKRLLIQVAKQINKKK